MNDLAIETKNLTKRYGEDILAVDNIDLSIQKNSITPCLVQMEPEKQPQSLC